MLHSMCGMWYQFSRHGHLTLSSLPPRPPFFLFFLDGGGELESCLVGIGPSLLDKKMQGMNIERSDLRQSRLQVSPWKANLITPPKQLHDITLTQQKRILPDEHTNCLSLRMSMFVCMQVGENKCHENTFQNVRNLKLSSPVLNRDSLLRRRRLRGGPAHSQEVHPQPVCASCA